MFNKYRRVRGSRLPLKARILAGTSVRTRTLRGEIGVVLIFDCPQASQERRGLLAAELAERTLSVRATPKPEQVAAACQGCGELPGSKVIELNQRRVVEYVSVYAPSSSTMEVCRLLLYLLRVAGSNTWRSFQ
jgi:hypothetical protein